MTIIETLAYRAPLAVLPVDDVTGAAVGDGITATAWPACAPALARAARPSPVSALLGFGALPGLWDQEHAAAPGDAEPVWPAPDPRPFALSVVDTLGRYLPQTVAVLAPATAPVTVRLSSAPARPRPPGWAAVTGLVRRGPEVGAAWALVEVDDGAATYVGACDERGAFALYLPYPEALPPLGAGGPSGAGVPAWDVTLTVFHQPGVLRPADDVDVAGPSGPGPGDLAPGEIPEISTIRAQGPARIVTPAGPVIDIVETLLFGPALVLVIDVVAAASP